VTIFERSASRPNPNAVFAMIAAFSAMSFDWALVNGFVI
jgi:hypothetical protein